MPQTTHRRFLFPASVRRKMSLAKLGKPLSPAHRAAVSKALKAAYAEGRIIPSHKVEMPAKAVR